MISFFECSLIIGLASYDSVISFFDSNISRNYTSSDFFLRIMTFSISNI